MTEAPPERTYRFLADLLERHSGQGLSPSRYWRAETVLNPILRAHALANVDALVSELTGSINRVLERQTVEAMLNHETSFFRDQSVFSTLTGPGLAAMREIRGHERRLRIWSAACSTGQEAYSLAIALCEDRQKWLDWDIDIVASDMSIVAVERAREGRFSQFEIQRGMPITLMLRYFRKDGEDWIARDQLRSMIHFRKQNLLQPMCMDSPFDIILCRNMIMYLQPEHRKTVYRNLENSICDDGFLMLGAAETVIGQTERFRSSRDYRGLYEPAGAQQARSAA